MGAHGRGWPVDAAAIDRVNRAFGTRVRLHPGFLSDALIADGSCDVVHGISVVEHITPDEIPGTVREAYRILRPGGHLVLTVDLFLHTLQTGEASRTGGHEIIRVDVRVMASTVHGGESNDQLWQELKGLSVVEICIPPLRQRTEEIPAWASFFLERFNRRYRRDVQLCPDVIARFKTHSWPGNIRELEEAVRQLVMGGGGDHSPL